MAEGYVTRVALDDDNEIIGYEFVNLGKMMDFMKKGDRRQRPRYKKAMGHYGQLRQRRPSTSTPVRNKEEDDNNGFV